MRTHPAEPPELSPGIAPSRHPRRALLFAALMLAAVVGFGALIHELLSSADGSAAALLIAFATLAASGVAASFGSTRPRTGLLLTAAAVLVAASAWPWLLDRVDLVYLAQHAGTHAILGAMFLATLVDVRLGRGEALITRLARRVHGELPPDIHRYTVQITIVWTCYFWLMTVASLGLYLLGRTATWSILANLVTMPLVAGLFIAEYGWRHWRFPDFEHASLLDSVRAFRQ